MNSEIHANYFTCLYTHKKYGLIEKIYEIITNFVTKFNIERES